jgi:hypothetical protein
MRTCSENHENDVDHVLQRQRLQQDSDIKMTPMPGPERVYAVGNEQLSLQRVKD